MPPGNDPWIRFFHCVPGFLILSGGLGEEEASLYLDPINRGGDRAPWNLGFSYGRALQHSFIQQWAGCDVAAGQRARLARLARLARA